YPANPESASPYSPSSRRWLNVIYIDVNAVEDFRHSKEAQKWWQSPATQQALQAARQTDDVDYTAVTALKLTALRMAWKGFSARNDETTAEFRQFVAREGESLYWQAAFDALHAWQVKQDPLRWGWPAWPKAYQDTDSPEVKAFCTEHADEVNFYLWLQWLAFTQFAE
ncbi:4-alpha-glucanotransferase, partial [Klebsiella michiganensis]